jgi:dihydrolipoamide dehydrogenase
MAAHGVQIENVRLDLAAMLQRKEQIVTTLTGGIRSLLRRHKITMMVGRGRFRDSQMLEVAGKDRAMVVTERTIIATGSVPASLRGVEVDGDRIGDSTTALSWTQPPEQLIVIGAGYIGLELGSVWRRLGSKVLVLEAMDRILPGLDDEIAKLAHKQFEKQGLSFRTGTRVESASVTGDKCTVHCADTDPLTADRVLVCTGRVPATGNIGLDVIGVETDRRGFISVDEDFQTAAEGVYAIGDCIGGAMLAHKASLEGIACVEKIVTGHGHVDYDAIPAIVYTHPEIASVGKNEEQLAEAGIEFRKGVCPYSANGRARTLGDTAGRVKILADAETDRLLGVHAIGLRAGDLIAEAAVAMTFHSTAEDLARVCHAHPTLSEIVMEAALAVDGRAIHT